DCIDWSIPCPSIFGRKKPLAEKTLKRIAEGIRRYVIESPKPFIVGNDVAPALAGGRHHALVSAFISRYFGGSRPAVAKELDAPLPTVTAWDHHALASV